MDGHDENKNEANGALGAQGIYSTPELTVDTEKIAPQDNSVNDKSRIASIFANTDAGRQAQDLNNAMMTPASSDDGDIVINNGPKKRSKIPIIVAAVVVVMAAGGVVLFSILQNPNREPEIIEQSKEDLARQAFSQYASYVITGEIKENYESNNNIGDPEVEKQLVSADQNTEFWNKSIELLKNARQTYTDLGNQDDLFTDTIDYNLGRLEFLRDYDTYPHFDIEVMTENYLQNGRDLMISSVKNAYGRYSDNESEVLRNYILTVTMAAEALADKLDLYVNAGCLVDSGLNEECMKALEDTNENAEIIDKSESLEIELQNFAQKVALDITIGAESMLDDIEAVTDSKEASAVN